MLSFLRNLITEAPAAPIPALRLRDAVATLPRGRPLTSGLPVNHAECQTFAGFCLQPQVREHILDCRLCLDVPDMAADLEMIEAVLQRGGVSDLRSRLIAEFPIALAVIYAAFSGQTNYSLVISDGWHEAHRLRTLICELLKRLRIAYQNGPRGQIHIGTCQIRCASLHMLPRWLCGKPDLVCIIPGEGLCLSEAPEPYLSQAQALAAGHAMGIPRLIIRR